MPTAIIEHEGKEVEYEFPDGMSEEEIVANFQSDFARMQIDARNYLRSGKEVSGYKKKKVGARGHRPTYYRTQELIDRNLPAALGVSSEDVDTKSGLPIKQRATLAALQDDNSRFAYLSKLYGKDNVEVINFKGKEEFLFKGKDSKWRMTDPKGVIDFADFTTDIAGEAAPVTAGIIAGGLAALSKYGILSTAAIANAAEATVGSAQDAIVRKATGLEIDPLEIAKRRSFNATLGFGAEVLTMGAMQTVPKLFVRRSGVDNATKSAKFLSDQTGYKLPTQMYLGEQSIKRIRDVAQRYPKSPTARLYEDLRAKIGQSVDELAAPGTTSEQSDVIIQNSLERIARDQTAEMQQLKSTLDDISAQQKVASQRGKGTGLEEQAKLDAQKIFNEEKKRRARDLVTSNEVSTRAVGDGLQLDLFKKFLRIDRQKVALYDEAYEAIGDAQVSSEAIREAYESLVSDGITDFDGKAIQALTDVASRKGLKSIDELGDIGEIDVPFRVLNELIQSVNKRAKFGVTGAGPEANKFRALSGKLESLRDEVLNANPNAKPLFDRAQKFYREEFLRYTDGLGGDILKLPRGQSFAEAKDAFLRDQSSIPNPRFSNKGVAVVNRALRSPDDIDEIIKLSQTPNETRLFLRQAWLQRKGLVSDGGLPKSAFNLSDDEKEIVRALWPQTNSRGKNVKLETFRSINNLVSGEKEYVDGITRETWQKLTASNTEVSEKELIRLAEQEKAVKEQYQILQQSAIRKMLNKGALDGEAKKNIRILMDTMDSLNFKEIQEIKRLLVQQDPANAELLQNSTIAHLLRRANKGRDDAQIERYGFQLWNANKMDDFLVNDEAKLSLMLGPEKYKMLKQWNDGLKITSVPRQAATSDLKAGVASSGGSASGYLSGITRWASNVWANAMLTASMKAPVNRVIMDAEAYDKVISMAFNLSAVTAPGIGALNEQMEESPEVEIMVRETFEGLVDDMRGAEELKAQLENKKAQEQEVTTQQP